MNKHRFSRLESYIERLVEGTFANLFGEAIDVRNIAMQLARVIEGNLAHNESKDPRPLAPDWYVIQLEPQTLERLTGEYPDLEARLQRYITEIVTKSGYKLVHEPKVEFSADATLATEQFLIQCNHQIYFTNGTALMTPIGLTQTELASRNPQLIIDGEKITFLRNPIINIGRSADNDIVIDDQHVSRHHLQLRARLGGYILFDVHSKSGTYVNNVTIREHQLQTGDVIRIGKTQMVYLEDSHQSRFTTSTFAPLEE